MNSEKKKFKPGLYVVATPIGNLGDISSRFKNILESSDYILCEDTRVTLKILNYLNIKSKLVAFHKFNENKETEKILNDLKKGKVISLLSDAGTPSLSDPGINLIEMCHQNSISLFPISGPSAITSAMSVSGFMDEFYFAGFLPKKNKELEDKLENLQKIEASIVLFFPARDLEKYQKYFLSYFPECEFFIAREMTKLHETYIRDKMENLKKYVDANQKGEMTFIISNKKIEKEVDIEKEIKLLIGKMSSKDISEYLSKKLDINKKSIYQKVLKIDE